MPPNLVKKYLKKRFKMKKYNNIVEALYVSKIIRKIAGISIFVLKVTPDNQITKEFTLFGFTFFVLWYVIYFYSTYIAHAEDQTIVRNIYSTKVQRYGDDLERIISSVFVVFAMWKIPVSFSRSISFMEVICNVDRAFESLGESIDYNRDAKSSFFMSIIQLVIYLIRLFTTWASLGYVEIPIQSERMFQVMYSDALALISTTHFCFFLIVVQSRFKYVNKVLEEIRSQKSWEYKLFARSNLATVNVQKAVILQERYICKKIRACAKIYSMLYKVTEATNKMFGVLLTFTIFVSLCYIILYMFYFMEATAAGLFHDVPRYMVFLIYVSWQIFYSLGIVVFVVFTCEQAMFEVRHAYFICIL
ncbi:uncharacterized protein LOC113495039 [Trichoplusia ni]|uniref:Gustatory receptor n=1 Tax=Trichoplusia ni TaxID=7111 RepID=A0A7E5VMJ8_TRINI|nr:uncharacterized protein LOC113495039 [Trichoplusia ni]